MALPPCYILHYYDNLGITQLILKPVLVLLLPLPALCSLRSHVTIGSINRLPIVPIVCIYLTKPLFCDIIHRHGLQPMPMYTSCFWR